MSITFSDVTFSGGVQLFAPGAEPPPPPPGDPYWSNVVVLLSTGTSNNSTPLSYNISNVNLTISGPPIGGSYSPYPTTSNTIGYSTTSNGGSMYLNQDSFSVTNNAAIQANTGDFTIDVWVYPFTQGSPSVRGITAKGQANSTGWEMFLSTANILHVAVANTVSNTGVTVSSNTWSHIAWSRSGTNSNIYLNGNLVINLNDSQNYNQSNVLYIGNDRNNQVSKSWVGLLSDYRFVKGTAIYTANFTVPSTPLTAVPNTSLLIPGYGQIFDSTRLNYISADNAVTSNAVTKFGNTSIFISGSLSTEGTLNLQAGGYNPPSGANLQFGTGNFTVEGWIYRTASGNSLQIMSRENTLVSAGWGVALSPTGNAAFRINGSEYRSNTPITTNTWTHFAFVRAGNNANLYINGNMAVTRNISGISFTSSYPTYIGAAGSTASGSYPHWRGYVEQVRITKGVARYTANFEVPTAAFPTFYGNP